MTVDDYVNIVILALAKPEEGKHDPFLAAKTSFAIAAVNALISEGHLRVKNV